MAVSSWYVVVESPRQWWVDCEGKPFGPFSTTSPMQRMVRSSWPPHSADDDRRLQVMVPNGVGGFEIAWEQLAERSD